MTMDEGCRAEALRHGRRQPPKAYVIFGDGTRVSVEVAATDEARARGLMFRDHLAEHEGMLFRFDVPGRHAFWMKNVRFDLDIVWLDSSCRIVSIVRRAKPCTEPRCPMYWPEREASAVLEVAGGFVDRHGVAVGDVVEIGGNDRDD